MTMIGNQVQDLARELSGDVAQAGRQVWLVGLGAVGLASNTTQAVFDMLVEEGHRMHKVEMKRVNRFVTTTTDELTDRLAKVGKVVEDNVQKTTKIMLTRLGLPSRKDVGELMTRVDQLTIKVEALKTRKKVARGR